MPVPLSKHQIPQCWQNSQNLTQTLTVLFRAVMYFQHMCISRRQLEQLRRPDQLTSSWTQPDALSQQLAKPRACTSLLGEGVTCCTQMPKCTFECFLKKMSRGKKPPKKKHYDENKLLFQETFISLLRVAAGMSRSAVPQCCLRGMSEYVSTLLHTPSTVLHVGAVHACNRLLSLTWNLHKTHICW